MRYIYHPQRDGYLDVKPSVCCRPCELTVGLTAVRVSSKDYFASDQVFNFALPLIIVDILYSTISIINVQIPSTHFLFMWKSTCGSLQSIKIMLVQRYFPGTINRCSLNFQLKYLLEYFLLALFSEIAELCHFNAINWLLISFDTLHKYLINYKNAVW